MRKKIQDQNLKLHKVFYNHNSYILVRKVTKHVITSATEHQSAHAAHTRDQSSSANERRRHASD